MSASLDDDQLLITKTFDAPASLVFSLWTDPVHFKNWMGPEDHTCIAAEMDLRVGGGYRGMIRSAAYGDSWFGGVYREIEPNRRLVFTFKWDGGPSADVESLVTILFEEQDGKTIQRFHQARFVSPARRDAHVGGWNSAFESERAYLEQLKETKQ